ncbi:hypothetical protein [Blastopirellula marina]|uniref:HTTM domain-containing protein n=1 Tax=Blastopirellula marina TaxID=124 RepID=A0A2S8GB49_9BACT|nr:hypothetical protein [Blastopirellula marina]PQO41682.1 hypothetical protein C5Y98_02865 [Blastopirellula marina]PTL46125.1 hypothetical protein C5Y97_02865 [Blastopirellula marina]
METVEHESPEARSNADRAFFLYQRLVSLFLPILIGVTSPIWLPQQQFPAVPAIGLLCPVPGLVDVGLLVLVVALSLSLLLAGPQFKWASALWLSLALALGFAFLLNQHRFQPWAYQFAVLAIFFGLAPREHARRLASWVALSVYFYSALSKLNPSFVNELGADFLATLGSFIGLAVEPTQLGPWKWLALAFPAFEMLAFLLLLNQRTRRIGVVTAGSMHLSLILVLGPFGLNHSWGVLLWNVFFLAQAILLFWFPLPAEVTETGGWKVRLAQAVCGIVLLFPTLELIGLGDPWPAWGLYASHVGRTHCFVVRHAVASFPKDLQKYVDTDSSDDLFVPIDLGRWSIETTGAPIYPGERFSFAVGRALVLKTGAANFVRFVVESPAGRFQDDRETDTFSGEELTQQSHERFWLNTLPRDYYLRD